MNLIILKETDFVSDNEVILKDRRAKHIISIHKGFKGKELTVGKLNSMIGRGLILDISKEEVRMEVKFFKNPPLESNIEIIMAMCRPKVFKRILQDITSMGVKKIHVIKTWKVEKSFWESPVLEEENILEAMILGLEQGKDTILPEIKIHKAFKPFVEDIAPVISENKICLLANPGGNEKVSKTNKEKMLVAIGPEGGFIPYEVDKFKEIGFKEISLGDRIYRVETTIPYIIGKLDIS